MLWITSEIYRFKLVTRTLEENSDDAIQNPVTESFEEVEVTTAIASEEIEETTIDFEEVIYI